MTFRLSNTLVSGRDKIGFVRALFCCRSQPAKKELVVASIMPLKSNLNKYTYYYYVYNIECNVCIIGRGFLCKHARIPPSTKQRELIAVKTRRIIADRRKRHVTNRHVIVSDQV